MTTTTSPFTIDPNHLDRELVDLPAATHEAAVNEADAWHEHAQAKAQLDVQRARLEAAKARILLQVRKNPEKFDLNAKPNESQVEATVLLQPEYEQHQQAVFGAQVKANTALHFAKLREAEVAALATKRQNVARLVDLLQTQYFAEREPAPHNETARRELADRHRRAVRVGVDDD